MNSSKSWVLVGTQFICIGLLTYMAALGEFKILYKGLAMFAVVLTIWAILVMSASRLSIFPEIKEGALFVRRGPYRLVRHPMYTAVLLLCMSFGLASHNWWSLLIWLLLLIDLLIKIDYEERLLVNTFQEYSYYQKKTYRLLPYIY